MKKLMPTTALPLPPSANTLINKGNSKTKFFGSKKKKEYFDSVWVIITQNKLNLELTNKIKLDVDVYFKNNSGKPDLDNRIKALQDALTYSNVFNDDSQIYEISARKHFDKGNPRVEVTLFDMGGIDD